MEHASELPRARVAPRAIAAATGAADGTKVWIAIGAFWFALFVYCMTSWVLGPDFEPVTFGRDKASPEYIQFIRGVEILMVALTGWLIYKFVIGPFIREGRLSFDGLFFLACFTLVLQEPWHSWI